MNDNSNGPSLLNDARKSMNAAMWLITICATPIEVLLLHRYPGVRYPGLPGALVLIFVPIFSLFWPHDDLRPLMWMLGAYLVIVIGNRIEAVSRAKRGLNNAHSYYDGYPALCFMFPKLSERVAKGIVEPLLVMFAGVLCTEWNAPLGWYLIWGGLSLRTVNHFARQSLNHQVLDLHDAMVGQKFVAEQYRNPNNRPAR